MRKPYGQMLKMLLCISFCTLFMAGEAYAKAVLPDFVELAAKNKPAVVNINTSKVVQPQLQQDRPSPQKSANPFDDFFERFIDRTPQRPYTARSLGSGLIISEDGYILTNYHVIAGADEVKVKLSDSREFKAQVKGGDEKLDIALLKIDAKEKLHVAPLGNSDALEVGEWVMAIGNPFGLGQTVTTGIVSAKGRVIGSGPYDDFIQTDASINPGNSGGPLFNTGGEVIGINTAIVAAGQGIGFAIPVNMVKEIIPQLKEKGKVSRGWFGVVVQPVTPELAQSFGLADIKGVLVSEVIKDSPAEKAGLKSGDLIIEFDRKPIHEMNELPRIAANMPVGKKALVRILRNGKAEEKTVVMEQMKEGEAGVAAIIQEKLGMVVTELTGELVAKFALKETSGLLVAKVKSGGAAEAAGLAPGDVIRQVDSTPITTIADFVNAVTPHAKGSVLRFFLRRGSTSLYVALRIN
ncbi:MAG: DegQ family serine endoprotease [Deltaproteobacteria bacterium]